MCVYTPEHGVSELFDAIACSRFLLGRGTEAVPRGSVQRSSPPHSRKTHLLASALGPKVDSWGCSVPPHLVCHSLSLAHRGNTLPQRINSFRMPFLVSGMLAHHISSSFHDLLLCFSIVLSCQSSLASVRTAPKCVCCCGLPEIWGQITASESSSPQ